MDKNSFCGPFEYAYKNGHKNFCELLIDCCLTHASTTRSIIVPPPKEVSRISSMTDKTQKINEVLNYILKTRLSKKELMKKKGRKIASLHRGFLYEIDVKDTKVMLNGVEIEEIAEQPKGTLFRSAHALVPKEYVKKKKEIEKKDTEKKEGSLSKKKKSKKKVVSKKPRKKRVKKVVPKKKSKIVQKKKRVKKVVPKKDMDDITKELSETILEEKPEEKKQGADDFEDEDEEEEEEYEEVTEEEAENKMAANDEWEDWEESKGGFGDWTEKENGQTDIVMI